MSFCSSDENPHLNRSHFFNLLKIFKFKKIIPSVPKPLELAVRYAFVEEPNRQDRAFDNERQELSLAANWFFSGHNNKLTLDFSRLWLDDDVLGRKESENRARLQWDVSF